MIGLYPANTVDDDVIEIYADESRSEVLMHWAPLRTQTERPVVDGVRSEYAAEPLPGRLHRAASSRASPTTSASSR